MGRACLELGSAELQTMLGVLVGFGGTVGVTCPEWPCATSNGGGHPGVPGCGVRGTLTRQGTDGTHAHPLCQTGLSPCGGTGSVPMGRGDGEWKHRGQGSPGRASQRWWQWGGSQKLSLSPVSSLLP